LARPARNCEAAGDVMTAGSRLSRRPCPAGLRRHQGDPAGNHRPQPRPV